MRFLGLGHTLMMVVEFALLSAKHEHEKRKRSDKRSVVSGFFMVIRLCWNVWLELMIIYIRGICVLKMDGSGLRVSSSLFVCCLSGC